MLLEMAEFHSALWLSSIHCVYVPHVLYPSVDGLLGCFHILVKCLDEKGQPKYSNSAVFVNGFELLLPDAHT